MERVWGVPRDSEAISTLYPPGPSASAVDRPQHIGEVWLTGNENRIANGEHAGKTLQELATACGPSLLGVGRSADHPSGQPVFPLLVKFLFTTDKLSVQLHPRDSDARKRNSWGKTEMWHILQAVPGACLAVGFRSDVPDSIIMDAAKLRDAATTGKIEQMLNWREVRAGETFFVPAGTVHAIGAGLTLCEIQQNSDITFRLYDYNRPGTDGKPRALHIDEAMEVIDTRSLGGRTSPLDWPGEVGSRQLLAACPYFVTERWELAAHALGDEKQQQVLRRFASQDDSAGKRPELWIVLEGAAQFEAGGSSLTIHAGEVVILPSDVASFRIHPLSRSIFLRTYPPDWERDVAAPLRAAGASADQLSRVCFPHSAAIEGKSQ